MSDQDQEFTQEEKDILQHVTSTDLIPKNFITKGEEEDARALPLFVGIDDYAKVELARLRMPTPEPGEIGAVVKNREVLKRFFVLRDVQASSIPGAIRADDLVAALQAAMADHPDAVVIVRASNEGGITHPLTVRWVDGMRAMDGGERVNLRDFIEITE